MAIAVERFLDGLVSDDVSAEYGLYIHATSQQNVSLNIGTEGGVETGTLNI